MRYNLKGLYELTKEENLAVMGHDGLPFSSLVASDAYYFVHDSTKEPIDFAEFFEKCVPVICYGDMVAGECEIHEADGVRWIGCDLYQLVKEVHSYKLIKLEHTRRMKDLYTDKQQEFAKLRFIKDGCPEEDAEKETWESMVDAFYDGKEEGALEEFHLWLDEKG